MLTSGFHFHNDFKYQLVKITTLDKSNMFHSPVSESTQFSISKGPCRFGGLGGKFDSSFGIMSTSALGPDAVSSAGTWWAGEGSGTSLEELQVPGALACCLIYEVRMVI